MHSDRSDRESPLTREVRLLSFALAAVFSIGLGAASPAPKSSSESGRALTSEELAGFCRSTDEVVHNACKFYILGVMNAVGVDNVLGACLPERLRESDVERIYRDLDARDLEFHPEDRKEDAIVGVMGVLVLKYPCKK